MSRSFAPFVLILLLLPILGSCRRVQNVSELHTATAPHVSRMFLKNGSQVQFDEDLGWFDARDSSIEGMTADSQHVQMSIHDLDRVETVREYSIVFVYAIAMGVAGVAAYAFFRLVDLL